MFKKYVFLLCVVTFVDLSARQVSAFDRYLGADEREELGAALAAHKYPLAVEHHPGDVGGDMAQEGIHHAREVVCYLSAHAHRDATLGILTHAHG